MIDNLNKVTFDYIFK